MQRARSPSQAAEVINSCREGRGEQEPDDWVDVETRLQFAIVVFAGWSCVTGRR
jgi:hypothetical protein